MTERLKGDYVKGFSLDILNRSHVDQQREEIPMQLQTPAPSDAFSVYLLFNLEAAYDFGHVILALGPMDGALETYSFYRQGTAVKAPALMACLEHPLTFAQIEASSGWIVHGQPGNYWNEHVNAALALWCTKEAFDQIRAFAEAKRANPGFIQLPYVRDRSACAGWCLFGSWKWQTVANVYSAQCVSSREPSGGCT